MFELSDTQFRLICISVSGTLFQLAVFIAAFNKSASAVNNLWFYIIFYVGLTAVNTFLYFKIFGNAT